MASEHGRIDPLPVIAHADPQLRVAVAKLDFDVACLRVVVGVPERLGSDLVNFVPHNRVQLARHPLNGNAEAGRPRGDTGQLVAQRPDTLSEIVAFER
jgi:hypothetical protein